MQLFRRQLSEYTTGRGRGGKLCRLRKPKDGRLPPEKTAFTGERPEIFLHLLEQFCFQEATIPTQIKMIHKAPQEKAEEGLRSRSRSSKQDQGKKHLLQKNQFCQFFNERF